MNTEPSVIYDFDPHNLPAEMLQAIGLVVAASSYSEWVVQHFIGALLGIDEIETIAVTQHMSQPLKDNVARSLIELNAKYAAVVDKADDLLDAVGDAFERRNQIVHNAFARHPDTGEVFSHRASSRGSTQIKLEKIAVHEIEEDATALYKAGMDLFTFMIALGIRPASRIRPIHEPLNRKKKARLERQNSNSGR